MKYERKNRKHNTVKTLTEAQKLAFAPLTFQTVSAMLKFGILEILADKNCTCSELVEMTNLSEYAIKVLMEVAEVSGLVQKNDEGKYFATQFGKVFLYDEMTRVNFNFVNDVCYLGASELSNSLKNSKPEGLNKFVQKSETIYPLLPTLPEQMKKSWYEFDNFYSDNCFEEIYEIISSNNPFEFYDIGGNTGKFERVCLKNNSKVTMLDLKENIEIVKKQITLKGCDFIPVDILKDKTLPKMKGAVLMSQFLDCFSKEQIISILEKVKASSSDGTKIYILEPFIDNQIFDGAKYALVHTSLYFTCMANGNSKMYSLEDMTSFVEKAGLKISKIHNNIGRHDYTLLECEK